ncbi:hypothetical protein G9A89_000941 [Geosiphon pyriformis]|nr:hypothetical protein G9A89_000941 [Geosiphon pyriformis]
MNKKAVWTALDRISQPILSTTPRKNMNLPLEADPKLLCAEEYMSFSQSTSHKEILNPYEGEIPVAELVYSFDWSTTQLGAMSTWTTSLRTTVDLCLHSVFPMALYYGPQKLLIYNQMWRPILKLKHPEALGKPAWEVWPEIWDVIGPIFDGVVSTGQGQFNDDLMLLLLRDGYTEECYFSFTFSPVFQEDGSVGGVFTAVQETTQRVLSARRLKTLGELGNRTPGAKSVEASCHLATAALRDNNADITYALIYLIGKNEAGEDNQTYVARLTATTFDDNLHTQSGDDGVEELIFVTGKSSRNLPDQLPKSHHVLNVTNAMEAFLKDIQKSKNNEMDQKSQLQSSDSLTQTESLTKSSFSSFTPESWPIEQVIRTNQHVLVTLADKSQAILLPVLTSFAGKTVLTAILICGVNVRRALDTEYLEFCQLVVGHVSSSLTNGRSREEERKQAETLADLNRQKIMFFQNISHELRTPLTLMLAPLEDAISSCAPDSPILYNLKMIQRNARRLLKLVNTLLQFSRIEAGRLEAHYCETDIAKVTTELASNFESMAKSFGLTFTLDIPSNETLQLQLEHKVYLDLDLYEKIVFNLCSNAFKYTWDGGVTIRLYADKMECGEVVILEVTDTGVGISPEHLPNIFQRFYRIESHQSRSHEGTGIGLALVKELAIRHGGDISVTSEVDVGTTFRVWIPTGYDQLPRKNVYINGIREGNAKYPIPSLRENQFSRNVDLYLEECKQWNTEKHDSQGFQTKFEEDDHEAKNTIEHLKTLSIASPTLGAAKDVRSPFLLEEFGSDPNRIKRVLVVDDNADMRNYLCNILKTEFEVRSATDGRDALNIITKHEIKPDLVLSDIMMPNMNGFELLKILRSDPSTKMIPVILLSARAGEEASVEGLERGADDYLIKPFNARELIARVRSNIKLSNLRHELVVQQRSQAETKQLLFSISSKIRSGFNIKEILSTAVEEIHRILVCESLLVLFSDPMNKGSAQIMAASAFDPEIQALVGTQISCKAIDSKESWGDQLDGSSDVNSPAYPLSSFLASFTGALQEQTAPVNNELPSFLNIGDTDNDILDLEIESHKNYFSQILNQHVSSMSVAIRLNSSFWGWIVAHRKPNENWSNAEKIFLQQISNQISLAITHSKLSEEKLKREAQMEAAKAANEAKSQILANTSHELRTPLGAIIGVLSAFEDTPLSSDQRDMVEIMTRASDVVLSVVNDILDAAKLEAQKITLMNRTFDLFDLVEKTIEIFGERAGTKQIELVLLFAPTELPKYVKSDPERLQQILMNLLSNSVKFTESGEIVLKISLASSDVQVKETGADTEPNIVKTGTLLVELTDTGIGIDPAFMKDIWESFSQGDPSMTRRQDGTGLGLSICKHLVSINGGDLGVQSELGKGSRFWFTWNVEPLTLSATPLTSPSQLATGEALFAVPAIVKSKRVIIIDPVETARSAMSAMLSPSVQKVEAFSDCSKAIMAAKAWHQQYHKSPCDMVFFNVTEKNAEQVLESAKEFISICGKNNLTIGLLVFWSVCGRALGKELIRKIGGNAAAICKPIMQRRLLECLHNNEIFNSTEVAELKSNVGFSINRFRIDDYEQHNRPTPSSSSQESTMTKNTTTELKEAKNNSEIDVDMIRETLLTSSTNASSDQQSPTKALKDVSQRPPSKRSASCEAQDSDQPETHHKSRTRAVSQSRCILCVEDNPINLKVIQHQLSKLGYQCLSATNGQEAVNLMQGDLDSSIGSDRVSLILMDCAMPVMSGFDASKAIRALGPPKSEIPIIALTASAVQGTRDKCLESGMNDYLTKPLKLLQLKEKLLQWLGDNQTT